MHINLPVERIEELLKRGLLGYGSAPLGIILTVPTLAQVRSLVAAGPEAELTLQCAAYASFMDIEATQTEAIYRTQIVFETITLTDIRDLIVKSEDIEWFEFKGSVIVDGERFHNPERVSYNSTLYNVSVMSDGKSTCHQFGGGHGTRFLEAII